MKHSMNICTLWLDVAICDLQVCVSEVMRTHFLRLIKYCMMFCKEKTHRDWPMLGYNTKELMSHHYVKMLLTT